MTLRETFITINANRAKGNRLTNIKIAINSQNTMRYTHSSDLGVSQVIVGGPCVNSHVITSDPMRHVDAWGRLCEVK